MKSAVGQSRDSFLSAQYKFSLQLGPIVLGSECVMQCIFHRPDLVPSPALHKSWKILHDLAKPNRLFLYYTSVYRYMILYDIFQDLPIIKYGIQIVYSHKMS